MKTDNSGLTERAFVLVTGAHGFLGRHVARLLSRQGETVLGLGHGDWSREEWESWGLSGWRRADVTRQTLEEYQETPSTIIHCAGGGSVSFSIEQPLADFERTVETTAHVLEYVRTAAPSCRVVYVSSASVYGNVDQFPIREDCHAAPISQYGVHKLMAEQLVASYARQFGTFAAVVRLFSVYGCGLRKQLLWDACRKFAANDTTFMGTGAEVRDWLHVEDAAELLLLAAQYASQDCPIVNGGSGEGVAVREILNHLGSKLNSSNPTPTFTGQWRQGDPSRYIAHIERAKSWGWSPKRHWEEGVDEYAAWWTKNSQ
ncbi:NAD-dependent epimerase/dehydratase family protein [Acidicapsa ligni]|uniref:NAD-dependent epimerase/dehydratase family protein n=1 Tax=Acidicapsa ligni TaxID=542300 RepID=UPI0021E0623D|nr:NAD-dependent epimerase/dehydratase family protein [Acidicapsa ligni]